MIRHFKSIEGIVQNILITWSKEDIQFVQSEERDSGMISRRIRNQYLLWDVTNPLTQHWHLNPEEREVIQGTDYSEDHPDAVSAAVLKALRVKLEKIKNKIDNLRY
jgi:hypothetical protein